MGVGGRGDDGATGLRMWGDGCRKGSGGEGEEGSAFNPDDFEKLSPYYSALDLNVHQSFSLMSL